MKATATYNSDQLQIDQTDEDQTITLRFLGKSILRDPSQFVMPILQKTLTEANKGKKRLVMDFRDLTYMNSSTLTPVIKILEIARVGEGQVTALYRKSLKWQDISFSALSIFGTQDGRIEVSGVE